MSRGIRILDTILYSSCNPKFTLLFCLFVLKTTKALKFQRRQPRVRIPLGTKTPFSKFFCRKIRIWQAKRWCREHCEILLSNSPGAKFWRKERDLGEEFRGIGFLEIKKHKEKTAKHFNQIKYEWISNDIYLTATYWNFSYFLAERERFELSIQFPVYTLSRGAP